MSNMVSAAKSMTTIILVSRVNETFEEGLKRVGMGFQRLDGKVDKYKSRKRSINIEIDI